MNRREPSPRSPALPPWILEFKTYAREELVAHLPFTLWGVFVGLLLTLLVLKIPLFSFGEEEFHAAHFIHIFFSAAAGSAIFRSYRDSLFKAIPVVFLSAVFLCTLSDSLIPFWSFLIFGRPTRIHICAVAHPVIVAGFAAWGFILGWVGIRFFSHCNRAFHLFHLLISTMASILYIVAYTPSVSLKDFLAIGIALFFSLVIPCILGDVTLPLCFVRLREEYLHEKVHHSKPV